MSKISIQPIGEFFETDKNGYIINPTSIEKIQPEYHEVIQDIIDLYRQRFGEKLYSVYLRGSVAKGTAIIGISDIDTWCIVDDVEENIDTQWRPFKKELFNKYPQFDDIEMGETPLSNIGRGYKILLHQSVCVYGKSVDVPNKKITSEFAMHAPNFRKRFDWFDELITKDSSPENIQRKCVWLMKTFLRIGLELTLDRAGKYSRDLYPCYEIFSEYYPEKESEMRQVLDLALNPTDDIDRLISIKENFGQWLLKECSKQEWKIYE